VSNYLSGYLGGEVRKLGSRSLTVYLVVGSVLSVAALAGITADVGWVGVRHAAVHADWVFVLMVPVAVAVSHLGYTLAYWQVARLERACDLSFSDALQLVVTGFGPVSPKGGFSLDAEALTRRGLSREDADRTMRVLGMLEYAVLAPLVLLAAIYMMAKGMKTQAGLLPSWVIGVPVGTVITVTVLVKWRRRGCPDSWWRPLRRYLDAIDGLLDLLRSVRQAPEALAGMLIYWAAEIIALGGCIDVFAHRRGAVAVMIVGYATGYALTRRSLPLSGAGIVEALMPFALNWVGFPLASAILAVIAYRIFNMWLAMIPAVISLRHTESRPRPSSGSKPKPGLVPADAA